MALSDILFGCAVRYFSKALVCQAEVKYMHCNVNPCPFIIIINGSLLKPNCS